MSENSNTPSTPASPPQTAAPEPQATPPEATRGSYLTVQQDFNLHHACRMLTAAFGFQTYLVGSVLTRANYRDVDLRCILFDDDFDAMFGTNKHRHKLMNVSLSEWLAARTGLPVDFQFQRMTEANAEFGGGRRSFIGVPLEERFNG